MVVRLFAGTDAHVLFCGSSEAVLFLSCILHGSFSRELPGVSFRGLSAPRDPMLIRQLMTVYIEFEMDIKVDNCKLYLCELRRDRQ